MYSQPVNRKLFFLLGLASIFFSTPLTADLNRWQKNDSTHLRLPQGYAVTPYQKQVYDGNFYHLTLFSRAFRQGELVYLEISNPQGRLPSSLLLQLFYDGYPLPLNRTSWGYRSFFGISPQTKPGKYPLQMILFDSDGHQEEDTFYLTVGKTKFPVSRSRLRFRLGKPLSPEKRSQIRKEREIKNRILSHRSQKIMIDSELAHPRNLHKITSPFWATRFIQFYRIHRGKRIYSKSRPRVHRGLDLRAYSGDPIYAVANGRVVLSRKMHYEGNFILMDHGQGIFSGYMHLSKSHVWRGKRVLAGQKIGNAGSTGQVTAAHLHWMLYVRKVPVDPLSLLSLPVRN